MEDDPDDACLLDADPPEGEPVADEPLDEALAADSREGDPDEVFPSNNELREDEPLDGGLPEGGGPGEEFCVGAEAEGCPFIGVGDGAGVDDWLLRGASDGAGPDGPSSTRMMTSGDSWFCSLRPPDEAAPGGALEP